MEKIKSCLLYFGMVWMACFCTPWAFADSLPPFKHVVVIILENTDAADALRQPYLRRLTQQGAYLNQFYALTHPSQPNYVALTSGNTYGVTGDQPIQLNVRNIADLVEAKGLNWKVYAEGYPGNCFDRPVYGKYVKRHVPFLSYSGINTNPKRCANVVAADQFGKDYSNRNLPAFSFYVPDLNDDGHNTNVGVASSWLEAQFGPLLSDAAFLQDTLVIVTFDESSMQGTNQIYTVLLGDHVMTGARSDTRYGFYHLLRTIEEVLGLGTLGQNDSKVSPILGVWK